MENSDNNTILNERSRPRKVELYACNAIIRKVPVTTQKLFSFKNVKT